MKIRILLTLFALLVTACSFAQGGGVISGVTGDKNAVSLPGATLKPDKYNRCTISDQNGYYEFHK